MKTWVIAAVVVVLAFAGYFYYQRSTGQEEPPTPVESAPALQPMVEAPEDPEPSPDASESDTGEQSGIGWQPPADAEVEQLPLPMLQDSDPVVLENLETMIGEPAMLRYVVGDNVISRVVATVDTLGSRKIPGVVQAVNGPATGFAASPNERPERIIRNEEGDEVPQFIINPANYERYTPYVELFESVSAQAWVEMYRQYHPLFLEAYRQMGYADGSFDNRLLVIIDELLATPEISDPVGLIKPEAYYLFTDSELESLTAGQKILLRMGRQNADRVKEKLREIRGLLQG